MHCHPFPATPRGTACAAHLLCASLAAGAVFAALPRSAQAQPAAAAAAARSYAIPAGPLGAALNRLGRESGALITFAPELVDGVQTRGASGSLGVAQALEALLAGTGLQAVRDASGAYALRKLPAVAAPASGSGGALAAVTVTAAAERTGATEGSGSYAPSTVSIGKGQHALKDVPQSVTVISRQRMDDQGLYSIDDVMAQAAGVSMTTNGVYGSKYTARGLDVTKVRYDGGVARKQTVAYYSRNGDDDMAPFDHVEVLRGADGLFSGAGEAGGVVNLSYKRPTPVFQAQGELSLGSWSNRRVEADISGPLAWEGRVRGRLVAAHQDKDHFYEYGHRRNSVLYGALETDLGPDTRLFGGIDHQNVDERATSWGHPRYRDGSLLTTNRRTNFTTPWSRAHSERTIAFAQLEHQWNADWNTRLRVEHHDIGIDHHTGSINGAIDPADNMGRYWGVSWAGGAKLLTADLSLQGSFDWLGRRHDVTLGMDWARTRADYLFSNPDFGSYVTTGLNPIVIPPLPEKFPGGPNEIVRHRGTEHGLYGSIQLRPIEDWTFIAGGRYVIKDKYDALSIYKGDPTLTATSERDVFIPYLGVVRALGKYTNVYASATQIYTSQSTKLAAPLPGTPLEPLRGSNYELGIKHELNDKLSASAALYRVEKKNMAVADPAYPVGSSWSPNPCCWFPDGYQLSQGLDLELNGELLPGWQASVGYTYNSNVNRRANDARFSTITPRHLFKLWTQYSFGGDWRGLRLGGGVVAQSSSYNAGSVNLYNPDTGRYDGASAPYRFTQVGYAVWSMRAEYALSSHASVSVNVNNLFDKTYFRSVSGTSMGNYYGDPRNVMVRLNVRY